MHNKTVRILRGVMAHWTETLEELVEEAYRVWNAHANDVDTLDAQHVETLWNTISNCAALTGEMRASQDKDGVEGYDA